MDPSGDDAQKEPDNYNNNDANEAKVDEKPSCSYFVLKKKRLCRMNPLAGQDYCAEHIPTVTLSKADAVDSEGGGGGVLERVPCPLDPKHTVAVDKLKGHLKKCNSRPPDNKDYYAESANSIAKPSDETELNILTMTQDEKVKIIMDLIKFHSEQVPEIDNYFGIHELLMEDFVRTDVGESALRHSTQIGSIAKILEDHGLLQNSTCFIEFGSGKGGLTYGLARVVNAKGLKNCKFILIDRTSPRYKKDNRAKNEGYAEVKIERIKISIEDLLVGKLPGISQYDNIVGVTKHLCGSGTDVALRSLLELKSNSERSKVRGLVFATCCHHRVEFTNFVGNEFLTKEFADGNFRALRQIAAWATNGDYKSTFLKDYFSVSESTIKFFLDMERRYSEIRLKKTMGRLVKEIMDHCRVRHILETCTDLNLSCKLVNYVDSSTTRENVAILAYPAKSLNQVD